MSYKDEMNKLRGMERALAHAIDMNRNGKLDDKEFDEFRRLLIKETLDRLPMDEHVKRVGTKQYAELSEMAGYDDGVPWFEGGKNREAIASKVVGDFVSRMYEAGVVDDATYRRQMEELGHLPDKMKAARLRSHLPDYVEPSDEQAAMEIWDSFNGNGNETAPPEELEDQTAQREMHEFATRRNAEERKKRESQPTWASGRGWSKAE